MTDKAPLTEWQCPSCGLTVRAIATQVVHRCGSKKNQHVDFVRKGK